MKLVIMAALVLAAGCKKKDAPPGEPPRAAPATDAAVLAPAPVALAIVAPNDYEYQAVRGLLAAPMDSVIAGRQVADGTIAGRRVVAIRSGWGKAHAAGAAALMLQRYAPPVVLIAGTGGGLKPSVANSGDTVIVDGTFQHDLGTLLSAEMMPWRPETPMEAPFDDLFHAPAPLVGAMWRATAPLTPEPWALPPGCKCKRSGEPEPGTCESVPARVGRDRPRSCVGVAATGDVFLADAKRAAQIAERARGVVVDMETAAVAQECANHGVPFVAVRVVADVVSPDGKSLYDCLKPQARERLAEVVGAVIPVLLDPASATGASPPSDALCAPHLSVAAVEQALSQDREALLRAPVAADLRLHSSP